jgi:RPA family protein
MAFKREVAHRVLASELLSSSHEIKGVGEKDPSFLLSPHGLKMNRVHFVGVCIEVSPVGEAGDTYRAKIVDPTGTVAVYAGQYQAEAANAIQQLQVPCIVAITGKPRVYEPEPGKKLISLRPESVHVVSEVDRDRNVVRAAESVLRRLRTPTADMEAAKAVYGEPDTAALKAKAISALKQILGTEAPSEPEVAITAAPASAAAAPTVATVQVPAKAAASSKAAEQEEADKKLDATVLTTIEALENDKGARWDDVLSACAPHDPETIEKSMNRLMDQGKVYEPTLGVLKTT